jgi:hypothetical protein
MKIKLFLLAAGFFFASVQLHAQASHIIKGIIRDDKNEELPGATVSLLKSKDSSLIKASFTDAVGAFEIEAPLKDTVLLSYTSVGFETKYSAPIFSNEHEALDILEVQLKAESKKLADVVITSKKPTIEVRADKVVFNVEGTINAAGNNALELLQKSPGVMVDNNENISLKGKSGVKVYIDGKMTQLDSKSLAAYLKSISSNDIEAIEMITNPGAKYDASGNAGIINIRLKKNKKFGTNGSLELGYGQGMKTRANGGFSLNYRDKKVNVFSNIGAYYGQNQNDLGLYRIQNDSVYDQHSRFENVWKSTDVKAGADYFLNDKNTIGMVVNGDFSNGSFKSNGTTNIYPQGSNVLSKTLESSNSVPSNRTNADFNVNYRYVDTNGTEIGFDADYALYRGRSNSYQPNYYFNPENVPLYQIINGNNTPTNINIYTAKLDLEHKLGKGKLGYGLKYANVKTDNTFEFYDYPTDFPIIDLDHSNRFTYTENVNAGYVNYNRTFTKWSLQAGLRAEQTNSEGVLTRADGQKQPDDDVKKNYLNFFPSAAISYTLNKNNTIGFNYSRRIDRPNYQDLNPFENKIDQLTYEKGNAFLKPQYTNKVELSYTFMSMINASIGYAHVKDYSVRVTDTINGDATYIQNRNLASQDFYSFNISSPLPIRKWWNGYVSFWYNYQVIDGKFNGQDLNFKSPGYGAYMQQTFTLGKGYSAEISGWYNGSGLEGTWKQKPMGAMDIGVQKRFWSDKANLKLSVSDVFHTQHFRASSNYGGVNMNIDQTQDSRVVRLNFTYRFGSNQIKEARQHKTAMDSEGNRIKR